MRERFNVSQKQSKGRIKREEVLTSIEEGFKRKVLPLWREWGKQVKVVYFFPTKN